MGERITLTEASRRYRITEKTLRHWIKQGDLQAEETRVQRRKQWQIDTEVIEQVIREKQSSGTLTIQYRDEQRDAQIQAHTQELEALKLRMENVERQLSQAPEFASQSQIQAPEPREPIVRTTRARQPKQTTRPEGTISLQELADELGISRSTLYEHVKHKAFEHISIQKPNRHGECERYFTPEQANVIREWRAQHTRTK